MRAVRVGPTCMAAFVTTLSSIGYAQGTGTVNSTGTAGDSSPGTSPAIARSSLPPEADRPARKKESGWTEHNGLFGPVRFGPVVGTGIPNLMSFGVTAKLWGYLGIGFNYGKIPELQIPTYGQASVKYHEYDGYVRVYPFAGGFFLGTGIGVHHAEGTDGQSVAVSTPAIQGIPQFQVAYAVSGRGTIRSTILTPQIGYFRNFAFGLALGIDIGAQVPISGTNATFQATVPEAVPAQYVANAQTRVTDTLHRVATMPVPSLNLRVGWLF